MKKINVWFDCLSCWALVSPSKWTCRNHCPFCFTSLHVDKDIPWDRLSECKSFMYPYEYNISNWEIKIHFKCVKCLSTHWNKASIDDDIWKLDYYIKKYQIKFEI